MAFANVTQLGASYQFGFQDSDAPTITGFVARAAELSFEPEVFVPAMDGEGHVDSITLSLAEKRKITGTFTGYITDAWDATASALSFDFKSRYFIIKRVGEPRRKGEYVETSLEVESYANITG